MLVNLGRINEGTWILFDGCLPTLTSRGVAYYVVFCVYFYLFMYLVDSVDRQSVSRCLFRVNPEKNAHTVELKNSTMKDCSRSDCQIM